MNQNTKSEKVHALLHSRTAVKGAIVLGVSVAVLAPFGLASGAPAFALRSETVAGHKGSLVNGASRTLYVLTSEKGSKIECKGSCLTIWPPLLVTTKTRTLRLGAGVKGKIGFVTFSKTKKQVTFNSYPLYTFSGDTGPRQAHGEGLKLARGTWALAKAAATNANATPVLKATTSTGGGYSGY